ncbi:MAG: hypothetical protein WCG47_05090 [Dermatophilaceae bacterium]
MSTRSAGHRRHLPNSPFNNQAAPAIEQFALNDRVTHDKHGLGRVVQEGEASVVVDFGAYQVRVASPFLRLTKLDEAPGLVAGGAPES